LRRSTGTGVTNLRLATTVLAGFISASTLTPLQAQGDDVGRVRRIADVTAIALAEYGEGVVGGRVVRVDELTEARLFLEEARRLAALLPEGVRDRALDTLREMQEGVDALVSEPELRALLRDLRALLAAAVGVPLDAYPTAAPSLDRGAAVYASRCASCHGDAGVGDGVMAASLDPAPSDLTAIDVLGDVPLIEYFRKINVGVAGTAMPAFVDQLDDFDRWSVAMYAAHLRYPSGAIERGTALLAACGPCGLEVGDLTRTADVPDDSLVTVLSQAVGRRFDAADAVAVAAYARVAPAREYLGGDRALRALRTVERAKSLATKAVTAARDGDHEAARRLALDAYLAFEGIESTVRARDAQRARRVEEAFAALRPTLGGETDAAARDRALEMVVRALDESVVPLVERTSAVALVGQSFVILFREGLEAILIVGALVAFLARAGVSERTRDIGLGVAAAGVASLLTAGALVTVFRAAPAYRELLEGATMLAAAAMLFWVSYWLVSKIELRKWQGFVRTQMSRALKSQRAWALAGVAFLAVYREGFETVLFYAALVASADGSASALGAIVSGMLAGAIVLAGVYAAMQRWGVRLPLKPFFAVTSALLYLMAFSFAGQGIAELQEAGVIDATPLAWVPSVPALGIFPTFQTLAGQFVLAVAMFGALSWVFWLEPRLAMARSVRR
jgi:high-affinity iron transporter